MDDNVKHSTMDPGWTSLPVEELDALRVANERLAEQVLTERATARTQLMIVTDERDDLRAENEQYGDQIRTQEWQLSEATKENERLTAIVLDGYERSEKAEAEVERQAEQIAALRRDIENALGGADCDRDHGMPDLCGWCLLREALAADAPATDVQG